MSDTQMSNLITALKLGQIDWLTYLALCRGETPVRKGAA